MESSKIHARALPSRTPAKIVRIGSVSVIDLTLFRIAQDIIGFGNLLEAFLGMFVARIDVRMKLASQLPISFLDLIGSFNL